MPRRTAKPTCACGLEPSVSISRSAKNPGRTYAGCPRWRPGAGRGCGYFAWLDGAQTPSPMPSSSGTHTQQTQPSTSGSSSSSSRLSPPSTSTTGGRSHEPQEVAGPRTPNRAAAPAPQQPPATPPAASRTPPKGPLGTLTASSAAWDCIAAFLLVAPDHNQQPHARQLLLPPAPGPPPPERVRLLLLPASSQQPAYCTQHLAQPAAEEGRLPWAPASLCSLQPPYVTLRHCSAARGLAGEVGLGPGSSSREPSGLFVLDSETTGLSGGEHGLPIGSTGGLRGERWLAH